MRISDWSSDVCSSDLLLLRRVQVQLLVEDDLADDLADLAGEVVARQLGGGGDVEALHDQRMHARLGGGHNAGMGGDRALGLAYRRRHAPRPRRPQLRRLPHRLAPAGLPGASITNSVVERGAYA